MALVPYTRNLRQQATYWAPLGNDGFGNQVFDAPVSIRCRWQDVAQLFRSPSGNQETSSAIVYVDRRLSLGGYLVEGVIESDSPIPVEGAREVRQLGSSPSLSAIYELLKVWL